MKVYLSKTTLEAEPEILILAYEAYVQGCCDLSFALKIFIPRFREKKFPLPPSAMESMAFLGGERRISKLLDFLRQRTAVYVQYVGYGWIQ